MKESFICNKNTILVVKSDDKVLFGIKAINNTQFYDKLMDKFNHMFKDLEEVRVNKANFNQNKNKGKIELLINTGGGMMPWQFLKYSIEPIDII